jgi:hypothetical protein
VAWIGVTPNAARPPSLSHLEASRALLGLAAPARVEPVPRGFRGKERQMVNHPNRTRPLEKGFDPEHLEWLENKVTGMEKELLRILGLRERDPKDDLYVALERAMGKLGDARGIIQKRRAAAAD